MTDPAAAHAVRIDDYEPNDARELVALWRASFEHGVGITDHHSLEDQLKFFLEQVVPNNRVRVAKTQGITVGFIASRPDSVSHLYVRVKNIGQGIGALLLNLAKAESSGSLWLYTFAQNQCARQFYEKHGFKELERESENMWKLEAIKYLWIRDRRSAA